MSTNKESEFRYLHFTPYFSHNNESQFRYLSSVPTVSPLPLQPSVFSYSLFASSTSQPALITLDLQLTILLMQPIRSFHQLPDPDYSTFSHPSSHAAAYSFLPTANLILFLPPAAIRSSDVLCLSPSTANRPVLSLSGHQSC